MCVIENNGACKQVSLDEVCKFNHALEKEQEDNGKKRKLGQEEEQDKRRNNEKAQQDDNKEKLKIDQIMTEDPVSFECIYSLKDWMKCVKFSLEFLRKDSDKEVKENWRCKVRMKIRKELQK